MSEPTITGRGAAGVGIAGLIATVSGYVVLWAAAQRLSLADNASFLAFWAALFLVFAVLGGVQNESTRAARASLSAAADEGDRAPILGTAMTVGVVLVAVLAVSSPLWLGRLFPDHTLVTGVTLALAALAFTGHSAVNGALAGRGDWPVYTRLVTAEALVRCAAVVAVVALAAPAWSYRVATASAALTWLVVVGVSGVARSAARARADVAVPTFRRNVLSGMTGAAASGLLVVGFPLLLRLTTSPEAYDQAAPLLMAVILTRAPLMLPLNAFQSVAISHFTASPDRAVGTLLRYLAVIVGIGVVGAGAAAAVGGWLMVLLLGAGYRVSAGVLAALTMAGALLAVITLTGAATLALSRHGAYVRGWLVATLVSAALLIVPGEMEVRACAALVVGPVVGAVIHLLAIRRPSTVPTEETAGD